MNSRRKLLLALIFCMSFISFAIPLISANNKLISIADSTIRESNPNGNYGGATDLLIGEWHGWNEAVMMFNLTNKPNTYTIAELWFEAMSLEENITLVFYTMNIIWTEDNITWNNAPGIGDLIGEVSINEAKVYKINISPFIENRTGLWSVQISSVLGTWIRIASRETQSGEIYPQIRFDHQEFAIGEDLSLIIAISIIFSSMGVVAYIMIKRRITKNYMFS